MLNNIKNYRTDLAIDKNIKYKTIYNYNNIKILENKIKNNIHHTILFNNFNNKKHIKKILKKEIELFFNILNIKSNDHIFIIGLGNDSITADSIGPKTINNIRANAHLKEILNENINIISTFEPSVLGKTGIDTFKTIKSISKEIKPNLVILIDSFITNNINYLNKTIIITNEGITPGSGIRANNTEINIKTLSIPVLTIGIPTAIELLIDKQQLIVSKNNIDEYIEFISNLIGETLNSIFYKL